MAPSPVTRRGLLAGLVAGAIAVTVGAVLVGASVESPFPEPGPGFGRGPVVASTPVTAEWAAAVDGLTAGLDPRSANACRAGRPDCLDAVVGEMDARLGRLECGHAAPFAFTYLQMTRGVEDRLDDPDFFADPRMLAQLDALFAQLYFDAFDNWVAGRHDDVPGAWQMAFAAADGQTASAAADLLLGMNADISRDLAYTVALVLEAAPEMTADPADFTLVNRVIAEVRGPLLIAAADRFDPTLADLEADLAPDPDLDAAALIGLWRERAFDFGRQLAEAPTTAERRAVEAEIERAAVASAAAILNGDAVFERGLPADERLTYCERAR